MKSRHLFIAWFVLLNGDKSASALAPLNPFNWGESAEAWMWWISDSQTCFLIPIVSFFLLQKLFRKVSTLKLAVK